MWEWMGNGKPPLEGFTQSPAIEVGNDLLLNCCSFRGS